MEWLKFVWTWMETHPWSSIVGIITLLGAIAGALTFFLTWPELWAKREQRKAEKRIKHYCQEIRKVKVLIENGKLNFETTQEALGSIALLKTGDETLRNEAYVRFTKGKC